MRGKTARMAVVLAGGIAGTLVASSGLVAGCGGDDTSTARDDGGGGLDGTVTDALGTQDQGATDSSPLEATPGPADAKNDTADGESGAGEGGGDVDAIALPALSGFPHAVDEVYCQHLQQCCQVQQAQWRQEGATGCAPTFDGFGGAFKVGAFGAAFDAGSVAYDRDAAANCLNTLANINCGNISEAAYSSLRSICFGAMQGTLGVDTGACINALQCKPGEYCSIAADGGTDSGIGVCALLATVGQPCKDTANSTDCTYLGNGNPALYCAPADGGGFACAPSLPSGGACSTSSAVCQSGICNYPSCVDSFVFSDPGNAGGLCAYFTVADAGDGG